MQYKLGTKMFKTKTEAKKFVSNFLRSHTIISDEDKSWIIDLLSRHPRWEEKSANMADICIYRHTSTYGFGIRKQDGTLEDISYLKCFDGETTHGLLIKAMRHSINDQIAEYKQSLLDELQCNFCKDGQQKNEMHLDHIIFFIHLVRDFLSENNLKVEDIPTKSTGMDRVICSAEIDNMWKTYHKNRATYQVLCKKCNLSKKPSKKADVTHLGHGAGHVSASIEQVQQ